MKTKYLFLTVLLSVLLLPASTYAFTVTDRSMTKLSDTLTMYTITFNAGFLNADLWLPIIATANKSAEENTEKVYSLVLSKEAIDGKMYHVPKRERGEFMLVVFEQVAPGSERSRTLTITDLPHHIQVEGKQRVKRSLTEEELKTFGVSRGE